MRRRLEASSRLSKQHLDHWPGAVQVCRLTRTTRRKPKGQSQFVETVEVAYAITSVPRERAGPAVLLDWWRNHWAIENRSHWVRDVTLDEDRCRIQAGHAAQNLAIVRNAMVSLLRLEGAANIAQALRECTWQTKRLLAKFGILKQ